jgi:putative transposase
VHLRLSSTAAIGSLPKSSVIASGYFCFALSFRGVEEMMSSRGVSLTYETVREWSLKFGQTYARGRRRSSARPGDQWHLDEVFLKIKGRLHYLWRAVAQDGGG